VPTPQSATDRLPRKRADARGRQHAAPPVAIEDIRRPLVTVDVVIFAIVEGRLSVLLVRRPTSSGELFPGAWALPGGFVDLRLDDTIEDCARRKLQNKTGVDAPYLEQLGTWGGRARDPRGWSVTTVYYALVRPEAVQLSVEQPDTPQWHPVEPDARPRPLAFDHDQLLDAALARLRSKVEYSVLPVYLMPETFTLPQLQMCFEAVLGRSLDKSAFRTRMRNAGVLEEVSERSRETNRPAQMYRVSEGGRVVLRTSFRGG
jgi:8-oxo-dGTP diphosphatase